MKTAVLSAALACLALASGALAAPVQLVQQLPDGSVAYGTGADTANGPLEVTFSASGGIAVTGLSWWGYHLPGSSMTDQFEIMLNGAVVGSQSTPVGTISGQDTGSSLADPAGGPDTVALFAYTLVLEPGVYTVAGVNTLALSNEDVGASWLWQGTGAAADPYASAFALVGDQGQQVPEPMSLALCLVALAAVAGATRRR